MNEYINWFFTAAVSVIAFFLIRFYYMVDEMRKDVKELLISEASKNQAIDNIREDVHEIKETVHEHDKRLQQIDVILAKIK